VISFDWVAFLQSTGIDHVVGPAQNVRRGHVGIDCPTCPGDTKKHFSIDVEKGTIKGCWRDKSHWMGPSALIAALARVSYEEANRMLESGEFPVTVSTAELLRELDRRDAPRVAPTGASAPWPKEFRPFTENPDRKERPFHYYLEDRGFSCPWVIAQTYGLRWCAQGDWKGRVAFPLRLAGRQVGWTGRAIGRSKLRYRTEPAGDLVRHLVWNLEEGDEGRILILCEGPFDALKVDCYAPHGVTAVALLGLSAGPSKVARIAKAAPGYDHVVLLLDRAAEAQAMDLATSMSVLHPRVAYLPEGVKDPGELTMSQVSEVLKTVFDSL